MGTPTFEVDRSTLVERVVRAHPTCIVATAPAGYGKSRLARQIGASVGSYALCDVSGVTTASELNQRIVLALLMAGAEDQSGAARAMAGFQTVGPPEETDHVTRTLWLQGNSPALLVIENAEAIAGSLECVERLLHLGANRNDRSLMICSRTALGRNALSRLSPHDIIRVGVSELQFSCEESQSLLADAPTERRIVDAAIDRAGGWPIAMLVFARAAHEQRLEAAVERSAGSSDINDYILSQAFGSLGDDDVALLAAAALLSPLTAKYQAAMQVTATDILTRALQHPFFVADGESIVVHPLAQVALSKNQRGRQLVLEAAQTLEPSDPLLAADMYAKAESFGNTARLLASSLAPSFLGDLSVELISLVGKLSGDVLVKYPQAWAALLSVRNSHITAQERLRESRLAWQNVKALAGDALSLATVGTAHFNAAVSIAQFEEADAVLTELERMLSSEPPDHLARRLCELYRMWGRQVRGELIDVAAAQALVPEFSRAVFLLEVDARHKIHLLERANARASMEEAAELTRASDQKLIHAVITMIAAFYAWLAGENALFNRHLARLISSRHPLIDAGISYFIECCVGDPVAAVPRNEVRHQRVYAAIIGASRCTDPAARIELAEFAVSAARECGKPVSLALAWLCLSFVSPLRRNEALKHATTQAARIEGGAWTRAIEQLERYEGALMPYLERFALPTPPTAIFRLATGSVSIADESIRLTAREAEVLTALLFAGRELPASSLAEMIFPDEDPDAAAKALRVWIGRIRNKLQPLDAIASLRSGYRISKSIISDVAYAESILEAAKHGHISQESTAFLTLFVGDDLALNGSALIDADWMARLIRRHREVRERALKLLET